MLPGDVSVGVRILLELRDGLCCTVEGPLASAFRAGSDV